MNFLNFQNEYGEFFKSAKEMDEFRVKFFSKFEPKEDKLQGKIDDLEADLDEMREDKEDVESDVRTYKGWVNSTIEYCKNHGINYSEVIK